MFGRRQKRDVIIHDVDRDADVRVTICKLNARSLEKARVQRHIAASQTMGTTTKAMGPEITKALFKDDGQEVVEPPEPPLEKKRKARYERYDRDSILLAGIESWDAKDEEGRVLPLDGSEGIANLDEEATQKLHEAILDLSLPPLDVKTQELAAKNDSGLSIES